MQDLRQTVLARYNSSAGVLMHFLSEMSAGDTWGYNFQGPLPRALLYRCLGVADLDKRI